MRNCRCGHCGERFRGEGGQIVIMGKCYTCLAPSQRRQFLISLENIICQLYSSLIPVGQRKVGRNKMYITGGYFRSYWCRKNKCSASVYRCKLECKTKELLHKRRGRDKIRYQFKLRTARPFWENDGPWSGRRSKNWCRHETKGAPARESRIGGWLVSPRISLEKNF